MDKTNATVKVDRARLLDQLNYALSTWDFESLSDDLDDVSKRINIIKEQFAQFEAAQVECLELHKDSSSARELLEEEYGRLHVLFIKWRESTDKWITQHENGSDDDRNSVTSRRSVASKASVRSKRRAEIELQRLQEEEQFIQEENDARLRAIAQRRAAAQRRAELELAVLASETDHEIDTGSDYEPAPLPPPPATDKPVQQLQSKPPSLNDATNASSSEATVLMAEAVTQIKHSVRRLDLPKIELMTFSGNVQDYTKFIRNFEACVDTKDITENEKLQFLIQNCSGEAKLCIEDCGLYGKHGYEKAKDILKARYGKPHKIARSFIDKLTSGTPLKPNDHKALTELSIEMAKCELNVSQLGFNSDINNSENIRKVARRLPYALRCKWTDHAYTITETGREPKFSDLTRFVERRAQVASSIYGEDLAREERSQSTKNRPQLRERRAAFAIEAKPQAARERKCHFCSGACANLEQCTKFAALSDVNVRRETARSARACYNCLRFGHRIRDCRKPNMCNVPDCGKRHHYMLHLEQAPPAVNTAQCNATSAKRSQAFLGIIPVEIKGKNGVCMEVNALIDNGSSRSFCHEKLLEKLKLDHKPVTYTVTTLTSEEQQHKGFEVNLNVRGVGCAQEVQLEGVWTVRHLAISMASAPRTADIEKYAHLRGVTLPAVVNEDVMLLIGTDADVHVPTEIRKPTQPYEPYAERTVLGWVVRGPDGKPGSHASVNFVSADPLSENLERMWTTDYSEKISSDVTHPSRDDKLALKKIEESCALVNGHYEVELPFKSSDQLPNNEYMARSRLAQLKKKLEKNPVLHEMYNKQMSENIAQGYMEEKTDDTARNIWYLPHHAVTNPNKPGKVRVVFDGAARFGGTSLNDNLHQGPDLLNSLTGILMRFRQGQVALSADIEGMFNQVKVTPCDRDSLRVLWWPNGELDKAPTHYRLTVQAFGLRSSPCIAAYAIHQTADDNAPDFSPLSIVSAKTAFYVDDFLKSVDDVTTASSLAEEMTALMSRGGFNLTKWLSNNEEVLQHIATEKRQPSVMSLSLCEAPTQRALGIRWEVATDTFTFKPQLSGTDDTKRGILSQTASLFDPLGLVAPVTLRAKCILQQICKLQLGWDDVIPTEIATQWVEWKNALPLLQNLHIDRRYFKEKTTAVELHMFSDASTIGYGACAYFRSPVQGQIVTSLVTGKSRVAPVKSVSVPRLELQAAVTATRLAAQIKRECEFEIKRTVYWTDSQVVLAFIRNNTKRFKTFVANRLTIIHEHTKPSEWRHVTSLQNVADIASRGIDASDEHNLKLWLHGPEFLKHDESKWSAEEPCTETIELADAYATCTTSQPNLLHYLLHSLSSWTKLLERTAWLQRFTQYIAAGVHKASERTEPLTAVDLQRAKAHVIRLTQQESFEAEIQLLNAGKPVNNSSCLINLNPQLRDGLLCVGGRIEHAKVSTASKHPIILPKNHDVTNLIIRENHAANGHMGTSQVLADLSKKYRIIHGRRAVRSVLSRCVKCKRFNARPQQQIMAPLREEQVTADKPCFTSVGADYFGPFYVHVKRSTEKRYGCIFVCLASRAIHIEVTHSLSSDSLLSAIRRLESRRGCVEKIFSDNGTNFVGGERELRECIAAWNQQHIQRDLRQRGIQWHFNVPHSSESGGIWERQIRTVRKVLCSISSSKTFTDEQLVTLMAEAERIVNNRPLTHVGDDANSVITPIMLITLKTDNCLPPGLFSSDDHYSVRRYRQAQYLSGVFWRRFMRDYLPSLQARQKWQRSSGNVRVGDIVLLTESTPRGLWPLARITGVNTSRDGHVRSCEVFSRGSTLTRPISKIVLLEAAE